MLIRNQREQRHVLKGHGDCWLWKAKRQQCSKGDNCGFLHNAKKRAKLTTQPASSPEQSKSQDVKDSAKAKSPRGRSQLGKITRMPCKHHLKGSWPTLAKPTLAKPTLAKFLTDFGQSWSWPTLAKPTLANFNVSKWPILVF